MVRTTPLQELQKQFCIIDIQGEIRVLDRGQVDEALNGDYEGDISFYKRQDAELVMARCLENLPVSSKVKVEIASFWVDPATIMYTQTAFNPNDTPPTTLNFWVGHTVCPELHNSKVIEDYLLEVICNHDVVSYHYLLRLLAHMLQFPSEKSGVMPILIGGQGTGKGVFFQLLDAIWSKTTLLVSDVNEVVGQFNAGLERNYVVCMDEALFSGDRRSIDKLKSIVTEPTIRIEQKYQPSRSIKSFHRFFAATNHDQFAITERDDRRFFFLRVSSQHQQDTAFFKQLCDSFSDGTTLEGFVAILLNYDLTDFNVRERPQTSEHSKQKIKSLEKFERYWLEVLQNGHFEVNEQRVPWGDGHFISTHDLGSFYKNHDRHADRYGAVQSNYITEAVRRLCPSAAPNRKSVSKNQQRGFNLPSIQVAREDFTRYCGLKFTWDN